MIRVTVYNEFYHEKHHESAMAVYPNGIHAVLAEFLGAEEDITVRTVTPYFSCKDCANCLHSSLFGVLLFNTTTKGLPNSLSSFTVRSSALT